MAHTIAQPRLTLAALLAALATVVLTLIAAGPTASVDLRAYDLLLAPMTPRATPSRVAVVTIAYVCFAFLLKSPLPASPFS